MSDQKIIVRRACMSDSSKIWLYHRLSDFFYIVDMKYDEFMDRFVDNGRMLYMFFRGILYALGENDFKIRWILRYREKNDDFIGFYCSYNSSSISCGTIYIILLLFPREMMFKEIRRILASKINLMRKMWVYLPP